MASFRDGFVKESSLRGPRKKRPRMEERRDSVKERGREGGVTMPVAAGNNT